MEIIAFVLIACIWAAFLLPSFFESRRAAPLSTTRSFAKSTALLGTVASSTGTELMARRRARERLSPECENCSLLPDKSVVFFDVFHKNERDRLHY